VDSALATAGSKDARLQLELDAACGH